MDRCVVEERVARLRDAGEEGRVGVEARVEEEGCGRAECMREAGLEGRVGVVVDEEPGAAGAEDRGRYVEGGEDARAEEGGG